MHRILIIEDDVAMRQALTNLLSSSDYTPVAIEEFSREKLLSAILSSETDLILLDLNLPEQNGVQLLKQIRQTSQTPVIMVTSSNSEIDEVLSMEYGADDYVTKPYSPNVLLLRIAAVLRRSDTPSRMIKFRDLNINMARGTIEQKPNGSTKPKRILLTKNEMIILGHLLDHQGEIVARDALMTDLWNNQEYINDNALTVNISRLRAKLESLGAGDAIETRKGLGYILAWSLNFKHRIGKL